MGCGVVGFLWCSVALFAWRPILAEGREEAVSASTSHGSLAGKGLGFERLGDGLGEFLVRQTSRKKKREEETHEERDAVDDDDVMQISSAPPSSWLFLLEISMFATAAGLAFQQGMAAHHRAASQSAAHNFVSPGGKARPQFLLTLAAALALRTLSLFCGIYPWRVKEMYGGEYPSVDFHGLRVWFHVVGRSVPSLVFLSAYTQITVFFAEIYYRSEFTEVPLLRPLTRAVNILCVVLFFVVALVTLVHHDFGIFRQSAMFFLGCCFVAVAFFWAWFGGKVVRRLHERSQTEMMSTARVRQSFLPCRMMVLSTICPTVFAVQGVYQICVGLHWLATYYPQPAVAWYWDAVVYLFVEFLPSMVTIYIFWGRKHSNGNSVRSSFSPLAQSLVPHASAAVDRRSLAVWSSPPDGILDHRLSTQAVG